MKNDVIKSKKTKLIESINKTWAAAQIDSKNAMLKAIKTGELLLELKKITPHGKWEERLNVSFEGTFGRKQAWKLMEMADNKALLLVVAGDDILSIHASQEAIKNATEEQREEAEQIAIAWQIEADVVAAQKAMAEIDRKNKAALEAKKKKEGWGETEPVPEKKEKPQVPEIDEDEEPRMKTQFQELDELLDEQFLNNKNLIEKNARLTAIMSADDQLDAALKEVDRLAAEVQFLNGRVDQLNKEKNDAIQYAKSCKKRLKKLEESMNQSRDL